MKNKAPVITLTGSFQDVLIASGMTILMLIMGYSCSSIKGYQKAYLNDTEMICDAKKLDYFEINFQTYREGASGSNGGKVGGGCGCN